MPGLFGQACAGQSPARSGGKAEYCNLCADLLWWAPMWNSNRPKDTPQVEGINQVARLRPYRRSAAPKHVLDSTPGYAYVAAVPARAGNGGYATRNSPQEI
jgi:hypothetical protein